MKTAILRNRETGKTRSLPYILETRKAVAVGDEKNPIWIPLSQAMSRNMMHLSQEEREMVKSLGLTVGTSYLYEVKDWIWAAKNL